MKNQNYLNLSDLIARLKANLRPCFISFHDNLTIFDMIKLSETLKIS